ncbi:MAG: hypothetical protein M3N68_00180 [Actinomycetota bacterium]|nr:hypothetical protein [Actinomycetota bacterium]
MPSDENMRLVGQFFDAVVNDPGRLDDICSKEFSLVEPDLFPAPFTDLAAYKAFLSENPLSGWTFTVTHAEPIGESVSIRYKGQGVWGGDPVTMLRKANLQFWEGRLQRYDGAPDSEGQAAEVGR